MSEIFDDTIPNNWTVAELGSLVDKIIGGGTPSRSNNAYYKGDIPWMTVKDMTSRRPGKISEHITLEAVVNSSTSLIPPLTIIIATRMSLGKIVMLPFEVAINQDLKALIIPKYIDKNYVEHWFVSRSGYLKSLGTGTTVKGIRLEVLNKLLVPLPPLNEQKRIVTKIEALQTRSTAVKEELKAIKPLLNQFRQSVLAAAFRGDLTKDWREQNPDVEPTEVLLELIRVERRRRWEEAELEKMRANGKVPSDDNWMKKYKEPEPIDKEDLPELPNGWCWVGFETIATIASNLVSPDSYLNYPHIAPDNIEKGSGRLLEFKTIQEDKVISPKHLFYPGQILYSKIRPYLSKCVLIDFQGLCSADMYPINSDVDTYYLFRYILSNIFLKLINKASGSRVVLPKANQKQLYSIPIPITSLKEQKEIVRRIESLFKLADNIEQQYQQAEADLETLNQSILAKAFRGELVPQDPNDEPASVLLERIKAERERDKAKPKKSKTEKKRSSKKEDKQLGIPGI